MSANCTPAQLAALTDFGYHVGLAFQVIDDILDVTQTSEQLGKTAGKDIAAQKATYPAIVGPGKIAQDCGATDGQGVCRAGHFQGQSRRPRSAGGISFEAGEIICGNAKNLALNRGLNKLFEWPAPIPG